MWRIGLILVGGLVYFLSMRVAALELKRLAGLGDGTRRLFRLVWIPYATAGVFAWCTPIVTIAHASAVSLAVASLGLNQTMGQGAALILAAASSFGAGSGMLALPTCSAG